MKRLLTLTLITTLYALIAFAGAWWAEGKAMSDLCATQAQQEACE